ARGAGGRGKANGARGDPVPGAGDPSREQLGATLAGLRRHDAELVAALAEDPVLGADLNVEHGGNGGEDGVANEMSLGVVDDLEAIEIEHEDGELPPSSAVAAGLVIQALHQGTVVADPGQPIDPGELSMSLP